MFDQQTQTRQPEETDDLSGLTPAGLLAAARAARRAADAEEARLLVVACGWADAHPPESIHDVASFSLPGLEHEEQIAGPGCPLVAEFCVAELGSVLGMSTVSAKHLIGQALELRHRLPRVWGLVQSGRVAAWRGRRIAEQTIHACPPLPAEAAAWVDAQIAPFAAKATVPQVERLVEEAITRFDLRDGPAGVDPDPDAPVQDTRHVSVHTDQVSWTGTVEVTAELALADGLDLATAITQGAETLKALGNGQGLDARRSEALGDLARHQLALDLRTRPDDRPRGGDGPGSTPAERAARAAGDDVVLPKARQVVLHVHLHAAATNAAKGTAGADGATGSGGVVSGGIGIEWDPLTRLEEGHRQVLLTQVQQWCHDTHTQVVIKPVIDLHQALATAGYRIPDQLREQIVLRDQTCVFPHCPRPARRCQIDHVIPYDHQAEAEGREQPGPTRSDNLAALCAFHHRLKTHGKWSYVMVALGVFEWTSPHGHRYRRDRHGTTPLDRAPRPPTTMTPPRTPPATSRRGHRHVCGGPAARA